MNAFKSLHHLLARFDVSGVIRRSLIPVCCALFLCGVNAQGQQQTKAQNQKRAPNQAILAQIKKLVAPPRKDIDLEIEGLVVDQTQSKLGRDFYDMFFEQWQAPPAAKNYTIVISEKSLARNGAMITLRINDEDVFENFLQPRADVMEELAAYALETAYGYLENYELIQQELQGDDMQGSGIF